MRLLTNLDVRYIFHLQYIFYILGFEQTDRYEGAVEGEKNLKMKAARMERGLSQTDLANAVGATRQTIGLIEAGRYNPSLKLCVAICKTLGKTLDDLVWE